MEYKALKLQDCVPKPRRRVGSRRTAWPTRERLPRPRPETSSILDYPLLLEKDCGAMSPASTDVTRSVHDASAAVIGASTAGAPVDAVVVGSPVVVLGLLIIPGAAAA